MKLIKNLKLSILPIIPFFLSGCATLQNIQPRVDVVDKEISSCSSFNLSTLLFDFYPSLTLIDERGEIRKKEDHKRISSLELCKKQDITQMMLYVGEKTQWATTIDIVGEQSLIEKNRGGITSLLIKDNQSSHYDAKYHVKNDTRYSIEEKRFVVNEDGEYNPKKIIEIISNQTGQKVSIDNKLTFRDKVFIRKGNYTMLGALEMIERDFFESRSYINFSEKENLFRISSQPEMKIEKKDFYIQTLNEMGVKYYSDGNRLVLNDHFSRSYHFLKRIEKEKPQFLEPFTFAIKEQEGIRLFQNGETVKINGSNVTIYLKEAPTHQRFSFVVYIDEQRFETTTNKEIELTIKNKPVTIFI